MEVCNDSVTEKAHAGEGCEKIACLHIFLEAFAKQHSKISMVYVHLNSNVFIIMFTITKLHSASRVNDSRMCLSKYNLSYWKFIFVLLNFVLRSGHEKAWMSPWRWWLGYQGRKKDGGSFILIISCHKGGRLNHSGRSAQLLLVSGFFYDNVLLHVDNSWCFLFFPHFETHYYLSNKINRLVGECCFPLYSTPR